MKETLHNALGRDQTRVRRAFNWVVTFRDFPIQSYQTVDAYSMMREALTMFTKGRAEFYLDGERRRDRVPGILSSEEPFEFHDGEFELVYVEPTTRLCIPAMMNRNSLPTVKKTVLAEGERFEVLGKYLVCLGSVSVNDKVFNEESTFRADEAREGVALQPSILLEFV